MVEDDLKFPVGADTLHRFERVVDHARVEEELSTLVGRAPLFSEFTREDVKILAQYMGVYRAQPNETIIREGEMGDYMLLIVRGEVDILKRGLQREQQQMTSVGAGTTIGEMSMIDGEPRSATVVAVGEVHVLMLPRSKFLKTIEAEPKIALAIMATLTGRLRALQAATA